MNGTSAINGTHTAPQLEASDAQVLQALHVIHDPRSKNEHRQEASQYLEQLKSHPEAPYQGFVYASNKQNDASFRYFGLSLLESAIRQRWLDYSGDQSVAVRRWVLELAQCIDKADAPFVRNKIAQLWVEVAKRSWALDWMDMDERLVELWSGHTVCKTLVLEVLENLSENSFGKEDATAVLRGQDLSKACVEIFTPAQVMLEHFPARDTSVNVRYGSEGWLTRIAEFVTWASRQGSLDDDSLSCVAKALSALKSVISWAILPAVSSSNCVEAVCEALTSSNRPIQLVRLLVTLASFTIPNMLTICSRLRSNASTLSILDTTLQTKMLSPLSDRCTAVV